MNDRLNELKKLRTILLENNFEEFNGEYGFVISIVFSDTHLFTIINHHYGTTNEVAPILADMGYIVDMGNETGTHRTKMTRIFAKETN